MEPARALVEVVRAERTGLIATLVRRFGFDLAEDAVASAIESALEQWSESGIPASPRAWLLSVARRRAIDRVRHRAVEDSVHSSLRAVAPDEAADGEPVAEFPDDRLRLLFTCCHPAIARDAQVALSLRWLSGLSTEEVARAFCVPVPTMAQRLTRAKAKIETAGIPYDVPEQSELAPRLASVLEVVYSIFNEGYVATSGSELQRIDLAEEALRLAELVVGLLPGSTDAIAMHALLMLIHARRAARATREGELVALEDQDRGLWDREAIARGKELLARALVPPDGEPPSAYAIEAAIQALHDEAESWAATDFRQIAVLYGLLRRRTDAPIVAVNEAVARAMVLGPRAGLADLLAIERSGSLDGHPALPAAKAELLRRLCDFGAAREAYDEAIRSTKNDAERRFLSRRRDALPVEGV